MCVCGGGGGGRGERGGENICGWFESTCICCPQLGLLVFLVNFSTNFEFNVHNFPQRRCNDH